MNAIRFGALVAVTLRHAAVSTLLFVAAAVLLLEEWLWNKGNAVAARLGNLPLLREIESWIRARKRRPALALFIAPVIVVYPLKGLALYAMARGYVSGGVAAFIVAKALATAMFARLYRLTEPAIIQFRTVRRGRNAFLRGRAFIHAWLEARPVYGQARRLIRRKTQRLKHRYNVAYRLQRQRSASRVAIRRARRARLLAHSEGAQAQEPVRARWKLVLKRRRSRTL